ncbi:MAG: ribosomal protein S18-alanine N-acetyltransferase [Polaromonas sp.]|nr:ribosomal protein S18-alanine N-acetyltransferase [Polaromonas sp.]
MTAVIQPPICLLDPLQTGAREARFEPMTPDRLDAVLVVEQSAYTYPWSRGNFADSLRSAYQAQLLCADAETHAPALLGYFVAMKGVDEVHLLNFTVAPAHQQQGWARVMLDALAIWSRGQGAQWLWLEVRGSNIRAKAVYERYGFRHVGLRKAYYPDGPAGRSQREDALVMSYALGAT